MKFLKVFTISLFIIFSSLNNVAYAESLKFPASTYEGEVDTKGRAHGIGIFTFSDGSKYEGKVSKNRIHGKGKYTNSEGKVFEGKFRYGTIKVKIDKKTRDVVKIKPDKALEIFSEIKGTTNKTSNKWFEAVKNSSGKYVMTASGKQEMEKASADADTGGDGGSGGSGGSGGGC